MPVPESDTHLTTHALWNSVMSQILSVLARFFKFQQDTEKREFNKIEYFSLNNLGLGAL